MAYSMMDPTMGFEIAPDLGASSGGAAASAAGGLLSGIGGVLGGPIGALLPAGLSLLGGLFGNKSSAKEANAARMFQLYMSNTAHQREVADLRAAGLNPILSATKGLGGASSPSSAPAQQSDPITPAVNSAMTFMRTMAEINRMDAETRRTQAQADLERSRVNQNLPQAEIEKMGSETQLNRARNTLVAAEINAELPATSAALSRAQIKQAEAYIQLINAQRLTEAEKRALTGYDAKIAEQTLKTATVEGRISESDAGPIFAFIKRMGGSLGSFLDLVPQTRTIRNVGGAVRSVTSGHGP